MDVRLQLSLLIFCLLALASSHPSSVPPSRRGSPTCRSLQCVLLAAKIASQMNASADPCTDFYNYACGNFPNVVKYNPARAASDPKRRHDLLLEKTLGLMADRQSRNIYELLQLDRVATSKDADISELYNFTRTFYHSCRQWMRLRSISTPNATDLSAVFLRGAYSNLIQTVVRSSGGVWSMEALLAALVNTGRSYLSVSMPKNFIQNVHKAKDSVLNRTVRVNVKTEFGYDNTKASWSAYAKVIKFLAKVQFRTSKLKLNFAGKAAAIRQAFDELFNASVLQQTRNLVPGCSESCLKGVNEMPSQILTLSELERLTACSSPNDTFSWRLFFKALVKSPVEMDLHSKIEVQNLTTVIKLVAFLKSRPLFVLYNTSEKEFSRHASLLIFDWLLSYADFFPEFLQGIKLVRTRAQTIRIPKSTDAPTICQNYTTVMLRPIVEQMYQKAYHTENFTDISQIIQLIKRALINSVRNQTWISPSGKTVITNKIEHMQQIIGILTARELKTFYKATLEDFRAVNLQTNNLENNFGSLMSIVMRSIFHQNSEFFAKGRILSVMDYFSSYKSLDLNAYNLYLYNFIAFPMAIFEPPVYDQSYPEYIKLGSLGFIVGHEIGHAFDKIGHRVSHSGSVGRIWDNETNDEFEKRMECLRSRYANYTLYPGGPMHNANASLSNDIADMIGISAATEALRSLTEQGHAMPRLPNLETDFSPEQMLFIQTAQTWCIKAEPNALLSHGQGTHSPGHLRVRGMVENSREFSHAFRCPSDAPMNPKNKCSFW